MAEYIEREAAVEVCSNQYKECLRKSDWCGDTVAWNIGFGIKAIPAADVVEVKHGRWIFETDTKHPWCDKAICSNCRTIIANNVTIAVDSGKKLFVEDNKYCPNCGARMDGE